MFSILKALCACTLPPLTCRCSKVDVSQIHMVNPVNDLKIAHIIACLGIFLWVQNLKLDIWTLETFLNMKKHMNAIICQKFIRKKSVKTLIYLTFWILVTNQFLSCPLWSDLKYGPNFNFKMYILFEDAMHGEIGSNPSEILGLCLMKWPGQNGSKHHNKINSSWCGVSQSSSV